jgi:hypothetical protein
MKKKSIKKEVARIINSRPKKKQVVHFRLYLNKSERPKFHIYAVYKHFCDDTSWAEGEDSCCTSLKSKVTCKACKDKIFQHEQHKSDKCL